MTSETPNLHFSKNPNISETKQDIEKLKTLLRLVWKCCSVAFKIGSTIFMSQGHLKDFKVLALTANNLFTFCSLELSTLGIQLIN